MHEIAPEIARLARRIVLSEAPDLDRPDAVAGAGERTWGRLRRRLVVLIGAEGFDALFARAIALARSDHPVLAEIRYEAANGYDLTDVRESAHERAPTDLLDALVAVTAHFLAVLVRLIGADLVVRVVREIWSELPPGDMEIIEETNE